MPRSHLHNVRQYRESEKESPSSAEEATAPTLKFRCSLEGDKKLKAISC